MINAESEAIVAVGAIIADIPMVDQDGHQPDRRRRLGDVEDGVVTVTVAERGRHRDAVSWLFPQAGRLAADRQDAAAGAARRRAGAAGGEIAAALAAAPGLRLLIGHGSGSFGHVAASQYGTRDGVQLAASSGAAMPRSRRVAAELNRLVVDALWEAGVPALRIQPSASAQCRDGELRALDERPMVAALCNGLVPVVHGDVALDDVRGGHDHLHRGDLPLAGARGCNPRRVVLVGEVAGVLTADPASGVRGELIAGDHPGDAARAGAGARRLARGGRDRRHGGQGGRDAGVGRRRRRRWRVQVISGLGPGLVPSRAAPIRPMRAGTRITAGRAIDFPIRNAAC